MEVSNNPPYMFSLKTVDYFFRWRFWTAPLLFVPVSVGFIYYAISSLHVAISTLAISFSGGLALWTLFEYCMHRFTFHTIAKIARLKHVHYVVHGMHHAYPTDPVRVIFPPFFSAIFGSVIGIAMFLLISPSLAAGIFSGFILGYAWYEFMHYAAHHIKWKISWFKNLKRHHLLHHHSMSFKDKNFGVTTSFWDRVFGTHLV